MDFLQYQLGLNYALEEKYDDALNILTEFIRRYPDNENRILVESLIDEIKKNAFFQQNTIGVLLPLSGPYEKFGYRALKGIELAMDQFSSQGDNPPINISVKDTGADPDKTVAALEELYQEQVAAILGPIVTSGIAAREAQRMGIPIMTLTQKDEIPEIGDKVFRNFSMAVLQCKWIIWIIRLMPELTLCNFPGNHITPGLNIPSVDQALVPDNDHIRKRQYNNIEPGS